MNISNNREICNQMRNRLINHTRVCAVELLELCRLLLVSMIDVLLQCELFGNYALIIIIHIYKHNVNLITRLSAMFSIASFACVLPVIYGWISKITHFRGNIILTRMKCNETARKC